MSLDRREVERLATAAGWDLDPKGKDLIVKPPDGPAYRLVFGHSSSNVDKNQVARLRRMGLAVGGLATPCAHTWHVTGEPGGLCPHCNRSFRLTLEPVHQEPTVQKSMTNPPQRDRIPCPECDFWTWSTTPNQLAEHVNDAHQPEPEPAPKEKPVATRQPTKRPQPDTESDEVIYEVVTVDSQGRQVLKDDTGDLFIAVPLVPKT